MGFYTSLKSERQGMPWRDSPLEREVEKPVNTFKLPLIMTLFPFGPAVLTSSDIPLGFRLIAEDQRRNVNRPDGKSRPFKAKLSSSGVRLVSLNAFN